MAYTLNGTNLGNVMSEKSKQSSELDVIAYPASFSKETTAEDYSGVIRNITLSGEKIGTGASLSAIQTDLMDNFVGPIDGLQNGQQETVYFHSDLWDARTSGDYTDGLFKVKVKSFDWEYKEGEPSIIVYTIELVEST